MPAWDQALGSSEGTRWCPGGLLDGLTSSSTSQQPSFLSPLLQTWLSLLVELMQLGKRVSL